MISLIIVNYKTPALLRGCLRSIEEHCPGAEVLVVDNASADGSAEMVRDEFPRAILFESPVNLGFAAANNVGLAACRGDAVVLLNSDTIVEDDSLQRCASWLVENPNVGALSPGLIGVDGRPQRCLYRFPSAKGRLRSALRLPEPREEDGEGWLAGTALMVRREALESIGGRLDDHFFMYWEDADFSSRLREAGWRLATLPDAHIRHYGGASGGGADDSRRSDLYAWYVYGRHRWFAKHRPPTESALMWALDALDVARKLTRGLTRPSRRCEVAQARVLATVLAGRLVGQAPPRPGRLLARRARAVSSPSRRSTQSCP